MDEPEGFPEDVSIEVFLNSGFFFPYGSVPLP